MTEQRIQEATAFIEETTGKTLSDGFGPSLKSGVILCEFLNKLKPGSVKKINTQKMPFFMMENIANYIEGSQKAGVDAAYNFMTVDLFEEKNLGQVALNVVTLKRLTGHGFDKQAPSTGAILNNDLGSDQTSKSDVVMPAAPVALNLNNDDLKRTGAAKVAGHKALNEHTGVANCNVCSKPISGSCVNACGVTWHPNCFTCKKCDKKLHELKFYEHGTPSKPYCDRCILIVNPQHSIKAATSDKHADLFKGK